MLTKKEVIFGTIADNKAKNASAKTLKYIDKVKKHDVLSTILSQISTAVHSGKYYLAVEIPKIVENKIFSEMRMRNYMVLKNNLKELITKHSDYVTKDSNGSPTQLTTNSHSVKALLNYTGKIQEQYFIVWAGSDGFCKKFFENEPKTNDELRGKQVMQYIEDETYIQPNNQEWIYPKIPISKEVNSTSKILIGRIAKTFKG